MHVVLLIRLYSYTADTSVLRTHQQATRTHTVPAHPHTIIYKQPSRTKQYKLGQPTQHTVTPATHQPVKPVVHYVTM